MIEASSRTRKAIRRLCLGGLLTAALTWVQAAHSQESRPAAPAPRPSTQPSGQNTRPSTQPVAKHEFVMSLDDRFAVSETEKWRVEVKKYLSLRFADVEVTPKKDKSFSLMLYFKCDTPDLAQFDSFAKIEKSIRSSSQEYLARAVEKKIEVKRLDPKGWYGCYTVLTDANLAKQAKVPEGEFKYITRGMVRLSRDSALGFSLMSNELDSPLYKELLDYITGFVQPKQ